MPTSSAGPSSSSAETSAHQTVAALIAAVSASDWAALASLAAAECTCTEVPFVGAMALIAPFAELRSALADFELAVEQLQVMGDEVLVRYSGRGVHRGFYPGALPRGASVQLRGVDLLRLEGGKILVRRAYWDRLGLLQQMTDPQPGVLPRAEVPVEVLSRFAPPTFLEGVLAGSDGSVYVTPLHEGTVYRVRPDGSREPYFHVDAGNGPWNGAWCMVAAADGAGFFLNVNSGDPSRHGVWHVGAAGKGRLHAALPPGTIPNGIARTADGALLVADSTGRIWRVAAQGEAALWLEHPWLAARPYIGRFPGANGIQVWRSTAYVTNSDLGLIVTIPIRANGSAGAPAIHAEGIGGDDFAIDEDGTLYVTTHPFNTVVRIGVDGRRAIIASAAQGMIGPTAAALGIDSSGERVLYVVTDGGMYTLPEGQPVPPPQQTPALLKLRLGR